MRSHLLLAALSALLAAGPADATDGSLDDSFGTDAQFPGYAFYTNPYGPTLYGTGTVMKTAANGQLYLVGSMDDVPNHRRVSIQRTDADGYPDYGFGDAGLRTYTFPCAGSVVSDAAIDSHGRVWVSFNGCDDFVAYRFTPAGDLDASLLGSGVLTIAFDTGDTNKDSAKRLVVAPDDSIIIAGTAAALPEKRLAIAHYTADGQPQPGFGVDGKITLATDLTFSYNDGLHLMPDGRIVATGKNAPNLMQCTQLLVRLQPNGNVDAGFGNHAPGVSMVNMGTLSGQPGKTIVSGGSLLEADGSILQVGGALYGGPNASMDYVVVKWRPDGQLDTSIGPFGYRRYGLDFAGANPGNVDHNYDRAKVISRQGDGKYVIAGDSYGSDGRQGVSLIRLTHDLQLDSGFGNGGKLRYLSTIASPGFDCSMTVDLLMAPGRIVVAQNVCSGDGIFLQSALGLRNDLLFANSFD